MWLWIWRIIIYSLYFGCFCHFWLILSHFDFTDSRTLSLAYHFWIDTVHRFRNDMISVSNTGCYMAKSPLSTLHPQIADKKHVAHRTREHASKTQGDLRDLPLFCHVCVCLFNTRFPMAGRIFFMEIKSSPTAPPDFLWPFWGVFVS